jgi:hypothetical protein
MSKPPVDSAGNPESGPQGPAWRQLELAARMTGGRYGVSLEPAPSGSDTEYVPERRVIRLDPERVEANPDEALWEVARESAHGLLSVPPERLLIDPRPFQERMGRLGFSSLYGYSEDAAATTWVSHRLPGVGEIGWRMHNERLSIEHQPVSGAEAHGTVERLGYVPRFVQFSQQLPRLAFRGEPATGLDPEVQREFEQLRPDAEQVVESVPPPGRLGSGVDSWRAWQAAEERHWRMSQYLWPAVERLAQLDLKDEALQKYLEELQEQASEQAGTEEESSSSNPLQQVPPEIRQELERHRRPEDTEHAERGDSEKAPDETDGSDALSEPSEQSEHPPGEREESEDSGQSGQAEETEESGESGESGASGESESTSGDPSPGEGSASQDGESAEGENGEPGQADSAAESGSGEADETNAEASDGSSVGSQESRGDEADVEDAGSPEHDERREAATEPGATGASDERPEAGSEQGGETSDSEEADSGADTEDPAGPASPLDGLSDEARDALAELYSDLPSEKQQELEQQARERLEQIEDAARAEAAAELETHEPRHSEAEQDDDSGGNQDAAELTPEAQLSEALRNRFLESLTPYERARTEVVGQIDNLYNRLTRLLRPDEVGGDNYGYPTGQQLDLTRVMPAEHDFEQKRRLWIRDQDPGQRDYRFMHVIDISQSMDGQKIRETQKGFMVAAEALDRLADYNSSELTVRQGMVGFHYDVMPIMDLGERVDTPVKEAIGALPGKTAIGTNTLAGTIYGFDALREDSGKTGNFLLTFSDGLPDHDIRRQLRDLIVGSREEREATNTFMGLILLGDDNAAYADGLAEEYGYDFVLYLPAIAEPAQDGRRAPDFSERLADLLERLVEERLPY